MDGSLFRRWIRRLFPTAPRSNPPGRHAFRPTLETLEERLTPSVTFAGQQTVGIGNGSYAVAVGDFNGDGRPDVVAANHTDGTVSVLLNTTQDGATAPSFAAQATFAAGTNPYSVAVADFNGDGRPDIVVANRNTAGTVSVLLNITAPGATAPAFAGPQTFNVGNTPYSVAVGDFNGDGHPDIAVANFNSNTVSVLLDTTPAGSATLSFASQATFNVGSNPISVAAGDFNGDGRPDLAVANHGGNSVSVLLDTTPVSSATATFAAQQSLAVGNQPYSVAVGDFNGDGRPDLVTANEGIGTVSVLIDTTAAGAAAATFAAQQTFTVGSNPFAVAVGDLDGDGRPDIVTANSATSGTVSVLTDTTAPGSTTASFAPQQTFAAGNLSAAAAAADFNNDGRADLVVANNGDKTASVLTDTTTPYATTTPVIVADFPGSGVWELNRAKNAWAQLNPADAAFLATDAAGDVVADFKGYGVFRYRPALGSWQPVNGMDPVALAVDPAGDIFLSFAGAGVGEFRADGSARLLTTATAMMMAADASGGLAADFKGYGVQRWWPSIGSWQPVNGQDAQALAVDAAGDIFVSIAGAGTAVFRRDGSAQLLSTNAATQLAADRYGDLVASLPGQGIAEWRPAYGWRGQSAAAATSLAMDANGDVFAEIAGYGIWDFEPYPGWYRLSPTDASLLAVA